VFDLVLADPLMSRRSQRSCLGNSADGNSSFGVPNTILPLAPGTDASLLDALAALCTQRGGRRERLSPQKCMPILQIANDLL